MDDPKKSFLVGKVVQSLEVDDDLFPRFWGVVVREDGASLHIMPHGLEVDYETPTDEVRREDFEVVERCCVTMAMAIQSGTDGEGYAPAIFEKDGPTIGSVDRPIVFCPWCGTKVAIEDREVKPPTGEAVPRRE